jgi:hypothetical protein
MTREEALEREHAAARPVVAVVKYDINVDQDRIWERAWEAVEQAAPEGEAMKRKWKFVEAKDLDDFKFGTKLGGSFYDETGAKLSVIGSVDAERIAGLLNGESNLADALAAIREADRLLRSVDLAGLTPVRWKALEAWRTLPAVSQALKEEK